MKYQVMLWVAALAALAATVGACAVEDGGPEVATESRPIIGGTVDEGDPAVVLLEGGGWMCSGTLVAPNVVLTAAHCLDAGRTAYFGNGFGDFFAQRNISRCYANRYFDMDYFFSGYDIALCRLTEDAPVEVDPVPFNTEPLDQSFIGAEIRAVGFGNTDGVNDTGGGTKRQVTQSILQIHYGTIVSGDDVTNVCQGDSGGPTLLSFDGTERIIAVTSFGPAGCLGPSEQTRVDVYESFVREIMDAWYGPCSADGECVTVGCSTIDPDCDVCGFDGVCATGCAKKDLDCPVGLYQGRLCQDREACEDLLCIPAPEDSRVKYCSVECDPGRPEDNYGCMLPLTACEDDGTGTYVCRYPGLTPSVQGAACTEGSQCRSGVCYSDDGICVEQCGDGLAECPDGFECNDVGSGVSACTLPIEGGGGPCELGRAGDRNRSPIGPLIGLMLLGLIVVAVRRRGNAR